MHSTGSVAPSSCMVRYSGTISFQSCTWRCARATRGSLASLASLGRRTGMAHLPVERHAVRRVLRQQLVQDRGAGARQARDEDRRSDGLARDLRAGACASRRAGAGSRASSRRRCARSARAERVELRLGVEGAHEDAVGLEEVRRRRSRTGRSSRSPRRAARRGRARSRRGRRSCGAPGPRRDAGPASSRWARPRACGFARLQLAARRASPGLPAP